MTFSIIGAGNIAWFFGSRFVAARHHCVGVYARKPDAAASLANTILADRHGSIDDFRDGEADVCVLAISDSSIDEVLFQAGVKHSMILTTAGAVALSDIRSAAKDRAVLWPVYSILRNAPPVHRNIPCAWEGTTPRASQYVQELGHAITDVLFEAKYDQRKWLHLSAVVGNNFINHLMAICEQVCQENGLPFSVLTPIIEQTFERTRHIAPHLAQTGPAIRRDATTVQKQLGLLASHPQWQKIYEAITQSIQANDFNKF